MPFTPTTSPPPPPLSDQLLANESRQIAALGSIEHLDYIFEDRAILAQGFKAVRMTYEVLSKINSPEILQKVVYGARPNVGFVVHSTQLPEVNKYVDQFVRFGSELGNVVYIMFMPESDKSFLDQCLEIEEMVGVRLESLSRSDRLLTLMLDQRNVRLWIATSTPGSRANFASTKFERLRLMPPARQPDAVVYQTPKERCSTMFTGAMLCLSFWV